MGDVVRGHFGRGGAAGVAETCETYRVLLDDMLARLDALCDGAAVWGDTVEMWLADARRLVGEINAGSPLVRVAQQVASRLGPLRFALEAMERQRPHDIREPDRSGEAALMAEARSVNDDLKSRLATPRESNSGAPILHPAGPTGRMSERLKAGQAMPIIAERTSLRRLGDEACSAIYHGAEALRAIGALALIALRLLRSRLHGFVAHIGFSRRSSGKLGGDAPRVMRKDAGDFLPTGGDAA